MLGLHLLLSCTQLALPIEQQLDLLCTDLGFTEELEGGTGCS